jgi:predicted ATPase
MARIEAIEVAGYKSIRSAMIPLGALNVLIGGANGSGKSNLLGVFGLLASLLDRRLQLHVGRQGGADRILHFGRKVTSSLRVCLRFGRPAYEAVLVPTDDNTLVFEEETAWNGKPFRSPFANPGWIFADDDEARATGESLGPGGHLESGLPASAPSPALPQMTGGAVGPGAPSTVVQVGGAATTPVALEMRGRRLYHFHDTSSSARLKQKQPIDDNRALHPEGDNLAPFLFALKTVSPGAYHRIVEAVRAVAPFFDDFALAPDTLNPELIQLAWRHVSHDRQFGPAALSDGTLRFMCLATLLLQPELPSTILIDEPELGLHPFAIQQLGALVRSAAVNTQIILATQSVTLLDEFNADETIVCEQHDGASVFRRVEDHTLAEWRDEYSLGDLWLKNVLGGRPR